MYASPTLVGQQGRGLDDPVGRLGFGKVGLHVFGFAECAAPAAGVIHTLTKVNSSGTFVSGSDLKPGHTIESQKTRLGMVIVWPYDRHVRITVCCPVVTAECTTNQE